MRHKISRQIKNHIRFLPLGALAVVLLLPTVFCLPVHASLDEYFEDYLSTLEDEDGPIRYAQCRMTGGKALLLFSIEEHHGLLVETRGGTVTRLGVLVERGGKTVVEETLGDADSDRRVAELFRQLSKLPSTVTAPRDLSAIINSRPAIPCR